MKKVLVSTLALMLLISTAFALNFSPKQLKLNAQKQIHYSFDGSSLTIPVTVSGTPSTTIFSVFTNDKAATISKVKNGYLGWHYVNKIDTCLYMALPVEFDAGSHNIIWDGKDDAKNAVSPGSYTFYLFGFDGITPKQKVQSTLPLVWNINIQEKDTQGNPLNNPFFVTALARWTIGNDPADNSLLQTTSVTLPTGYVMNAAWAPCSMAALLPTDHNIFFIECGNPDSKTQAVSSYKWVPNGAAELQVAFGDNGYSFFSGNMQWEPGVVTDGKYLYSGNAEQPSNIAEASFVIIDFEGTKMAEIDLTPWWSNKSEMEAGGQMNGGPLNFFERNGSVFLNAHSTCLKQMVNPLAENQDDFCVWTNSNGDYVLDHNFASDAQMKWVCNDYNVGPYTYNITSDSNMFSMCPAYDMGAVSIGLLAPDGTGIGYFAFSGETASGKAGDLMCDNGSAFDGIYTSNNDGGKADANSSIWYVAQDSFKGVISNIVEVADAAPAAFAVAQNSPNPFNPATTISFTLAKAGKTSVEVYNVAGQKIDTLVNGSMSAGSHSVVWNAAKFSAGVYFYTVKSGNLSKTMKMTLLK